MAALHCCTARVVSHNSGAHFLIPNHAWISKAITTARGPNRYYQPPGDCQVLDCMQHENGGIYRVLSDGVHSVGAELTEAAYKAWMETQTPARPHTDLRRFQVGQHDNPSRFG